MSNWTEFLVKILSSIIDWLPAKFRWWFGVLLGTLWFDVFRFRRWTVLKNLTIAFPEKSKEERIKIGRHSLWYMCAGFPEIVRLPVANKLWVKNEVIFHFEEKFQQALDKGKGVFLLSLHMGVGDLGIAALSLRGWPVHIITKKFKNKFLNDLWFGLRGKLGTQFIEAHGSETAFKILKACRKKEAVIFVIDQFMGKPFGIKTTFFGRKTGTAYGLALFAAKTHAPVLPVYSYRDSDFKTHIVFLDEILLEHNEDQDLQILQMTEKYNKALEQVIRLHPEQWMWVHRRWKKWE